MKEIGGYLDFELLEGKPFYSKLLKFNSSRNALRFLIQEKNIKKIYLPIFLCNVVYEACKKEKVEIEFYHIDNHFYPILDDCEDYIYIVNYYGLISNQEIIKLKRKFSNVIIDNTHSFFQKPLKGIDTIYNCRKYFGVPDGAYLSTNLDNPNINNQSVKDMFGHLLGRMEENASLYYQEFSLNDQKFDNMEIKAMSKETDNIMHAINYKSVLKKRKDNYNYLYLKLRNIQKLKTKKNCTFMYPLMVGNNIDSTKLRNYLIENKIYIPKLWENIPNHVELNQWEKNFSNILPIPIDQRYTINDMQHVMNLIKKYIGRDIHE